MLELRIINAGQALPLFDLPMHLGRAQAAREIGDTIEGMIAFLDDLGADPDIEPDGDELDGDGSEDDFMHHNSTDWGAGCPIADAGEEHDDDGCTAGEDNLTDWGPWALARAFPGCYGLDRTPGDTEDAEPATCVEWHTRGRHKLDRYGAEILVRDRVGNPVHEDAEDDDSDTGVEDHPNGFDPEEDMCLAGDDRVSSGSCTGAILVCEDTGPGDADDAEHFLATANVPCDVVLALEPNIFTGKREKLGRSNLLTSFRTNGGVERSADYPGATHRRRGSAPFRAGDAVR